MSFVVKGIDNSSKCLRLQNLESHITLKKKEENAASPGCAVKPHGRALEPEGTAFVFSLSGYFGREMSGA